MTETYEKLNHWYGWNGGECPVHPATVVECSYMDKRGVLSGDARSFPWNGQTFRGVETDRPCAFRIIKLHVEPREFWIVGTLVYRDKRSAITEFPGTPAIHVREVEQPL